MEKQQSEAKATINWDDLKAVGIDPEKLKKEDRENLSQGGKTGKINFSIDDTAENRERLNKEKVEYKVEDGKLNFEGKAASHKYSTVDNTEEIKVQLKKNNIEYSEEGKHLKLDDINTRKLFIAGVTAVYPVAGIALMVIPKRHEIKNDFSFSKDEVKALNDNKIVVKDNLKGEKTLYQKDSDTNEIVSVKANDISIPKKINGVDITPMQMELLKNGKEITLTNDTLNISSNVRLDLNAKNGLAITPIQYSQEYSKKQEEEQKQSQQQDPSEKTKQEKKQEVKQEEKETLHKTPEVTDRDRLVLIHQKGATGIDEAFKDKESEKKEFLKKYNLSYSYSEYKAVDEKLSSASQTNNKEQMETLTTKKESIDSTIKNTANKFIGMDIVQNHKNKINL